MEQLQDPITKNEKEAENTLRRWVENRDKIFNFHLYEKVQKRQSDIKIDENLKYFADQRLKFIYSKIVGIIKLQNMIRIKRKRKLFS
jgi:hypothetical protein